MKTTSISELFSLVVALVIIVLGCANYYYYYTDQPPPEQHVILDARGAAMGTKEFLRLAAININTATVDELKELPGIGDVISARIVAYREEHGFFSSVEELDKVRGIGPKTVHKLLVTAYTE